jgi:glutathione peroxidase
MFMLGSLFVTGIFDYSFIDINNQQINLSMYQGKKMLFVNTASNSVYTNQYTSLEQLYQKYKDSLVIVAFPSNDFGNEPGTNAQIEDFVQNNYQTHFILASKVVVTGTEQIPIYQWLTQAINNGMVSNTINNDFFKFLIDGTGHLIGVFDSGTDPMSETIQSAIINN